MTKYIRLPELFSELEVTRVQRKYHQVTNQLQKFPLVILDEVFLIPASDQEQKDLLELMESRCGQAAIIFCCQFIPEGWHEKVGGSVLTDFINTVIPDGSMGTFLCGKEQADQN